MIRPWAEPLVYQGNTVQVMGDTTEGAILEEDGVHIVGETTSVEARYSDVPGIKKGSRVTFRSKTWTVYNFGRAGDALMVTLFLQEAP